MKKLILLIFVMSIGITAVLAQCTATIIDHGDETCLAPCNGWATVEATGTEPISYQWDFFAGEQTTATATGLCGFQPAKANYYVTITDSDGCTAVAGVNIDLPPQINIDSTNIIYPVCNNFCDGTATIYASGGNPPYTYLWDDPASQTDSTAINLCGQNYNFTITDALGCTYSDMVWLNNPLPIAVSINSVMDASTCVSPSGSIYINVANGLIPYTFLWSNSSTTQDITGIVPGLYSVSVTDVNGCTGQLTVPVNAMNGPTPTITQYLPGCYGSSDGSLKVFGNTTPPFTYIWSNAATTDSISGLAAGFYSVTVTNLSLCQGFAYVQLGQPDSLHLQLSSNNVICSGQSSGSINSSVTGGTQEAAYPYYHFTWSAGLPQDTMEYLLNLSVGPYFVTVSDLNGCTTTGNTFVGSRPPVTITIEATPVTCNGLCDGQIIVHTTGGEPPYIVNLDSTQFLMDTVYTGLCPGSHFVSVQDQYYCSATTYYTPTVFIDPPVFSISATTTNPTCLAWDGAIDLTPTGGVAPYDYLWNGTDITEDLNGIAEGSYFVVVTDSFGCVLSDSYSITQSSWPANINGTVHYSGGLLASGTATAELYLEENTGLAWEYTLQRSFSVGSTGDFFFGDVLPGNYTIRVKVDSTSWYPNLLDTYYDSTVSWQNAIILTPACDDIITKTVAMYELTPSTGTGSLSGYITYVNSKGTKAMGEPVPGAEVYVEQEPNDEPISNTSTDTAGYYNVGNLPLGFYYTLMVDIPGLPQLTTWDSVNVTTTDTIFGDLNFLVDTMSGGGIYVDSVLSSTSVVISKGLEVSIYPNPAIEEFNINYLLEKNSFISIDIINAEGEKVSQLINSRQEEGIYRYTVNPAKSGMHAGIYFVRFASGNTVYLKKIVLLN